MNEQLAEVARGRNFTVKVNPLHTLALLRVELHARKNKSYPSGNKRMKVLTCDE